MRAFTFLHRSAPTARRPRLGLETLEARDVPATQLYATGAGAGTPPQVVVRDATNTVVAQFMAFDPRFTGGVHVATGDVNGDGVTDVIVGAGPGGGPHVKVFDGAALLTGQPVELFSFFAYDAAFQGGVFVAGGDVNGDHHADIITGACPGGGPHVKAISGADGSELMSFFAYAPNVPFGVSVAADDMGGDNGGTPGGIGTAEIVTGAGPGGGPHVKVFDYEPTFAASHALTLASFYAFEESFRGGVNVATGFTTDNRDSSNFRYADIIAGRGPGGLPEVRVFRLLDAPNLPNGLPEFFYNQAASFLAYAPNVPFGVHVGSRFRPGQATDDIITGAGFGGQSHVRIWSGQVIGDLQSFVPTLNSEFMAYSPDFLGGVFVGGGQKLHATD
jgi:hypothetical protein